MRIPYPYTSVQTPRRDLLAIKRNGVYLAKMARQYAQTLSLRNRPDPRRRVVAAGRDEVPVDFDAADTGLVADEDVLADAFGYVPDAQGCVSGAGDGGVGVGHF